MKTTEKVEQAPSLEAASPEFTEGALFQSKFTPTQDYVFKNDKIEISYSGAAGKPAKISTLAYRQTLDPHSPYISTVDTVHTPNSLVTLFTDKSLKDLEFGKYQFEKTELGARFVLRNATGLTVTKEFEYVPNSYLLDAKFRFQFPKENQKDWGYVMIPLGASEVNFDARSPLQKWEVVVNKDDSISRTAVNSLEKGDQVVQGKIGWVAFGNAYFATALVNHSAMNPDVVLHSERYFSGAYLRFPLKAKSGEDLTLSFQIFSGPKELSEISKVASLTPLIDYGFFSVFAYPLLHFLKLLYAWFHNYGVAIILLTIVVRILFYPLSAKSYKSMKAMQKLNPQIKAMKEKYGNDRERLSREQLALFKAHKVNPASGCVPMLLQLPVFFALYSVLGNSIELFHAPFFGWIKDLSSHDPYFIYPVLMGLTMFLQQKITPSVGMDPMQRKMMLFIMPVVFTFVMLRLPSGLTLYIFVSSLLGMAQQWVMMRDHQSNESVAGAVVKG